MDCESGSCERRMLEAGSTMYGDKRVGCVLGSFGIGGSEGGGEVGYMSKG